MLNSVILGDAGAHRIKMGCYNESINIKSRMGDRFCVAGVFDFIDVEQYKYNMDSTLVPIPQRR